MNEFRYSIYGTEEGAIVVCNQCHDADGSRVEVWGGQGKPFVKAFTALLRHEHDKHKR